MTDAVACIPSIGMAQHLLLPVLDVLDDCCVPVRVYDNREIEQSWPEVKAEIVRIPGKSIYAAMNLGMLWGFELNASVLILNDDIEISPCLVNTLITTLKESPEYGLISGHTRHGVTICNGGPLYEITPNRGRRDFTNWCFIARPSSWRDIDERYRIWYGDDDMIHKIHSSGAKIGVLSNVGVRHETSTTSRQLGWVWAATKEDEQLWSGR